LADHKGNLSAAARAAGIQRHYFRDLVRKHGLNTNSGDDE
jgi:hypothetical protein